jgi:hypothetical protein
VKRRRRVKGTKTGAKAPATGRSEETDDEDAVEDAAAEDDDAIDDSAADAADAADGSETCLYGRWQVQRHVPVPLVDGQVPVNAHGNFELWSR